MQFTIFRHIFVVIGFVRYPAMYLRYILCKISNYSGPTPIHAPSPLPPTVSLLVVTSGVSAVDTATQTEEVHLDLSSLLNELTGSFSSRPLETPSSPSFRHLLEAEISMSSPLARLCVPETTSISRLISCMDVAACTGGPPSVFSIKVHDFHNYNL